MWMPAADQAGICTVSATSETRRKGIYTPAYRTAGGPSRRSKPRLLPSHPAKAARAAGLDWAGQCSAGARWSVPLPAPRSASVTPCLRKWRLEPGRRHLPGDGHHNPIRIHACGRDFKAELLLGAGIQTNQQEEGGPVREPCPQPPPLSFEFGPSNSDDDMCNCRHSATLPSSHRGRGIDPGTPLPMVVRAPSRGIRARACSANTGNRWKASPTATAAKLVVGGRGGGVRCSNSVE